jgi:hypothetical protein
MVNAYRDFSKYERHFKNFLIQSRNLRGFELRVYVDDTTKDIILPIVKSHAHVSVYHYNCPPFREGPGHTGIFGMVSRFLPLFEDGLEVVWISDIDISPNFLDPTILTVMKRVNSDVFISTMLCSERKPWLKVKYPIIAHRIISRVTFPKQIMTRFLNRVLNGDLNDLISEINVYNSRKSDESIFPYGLDEAFINSSIYNSIKKRDIKVVVNKDYFMQNIITYNAPNISQSEADALSQFYRSPTPELFKKVKGIYKTHVPTILDKYPCLQELLDNLDTFKTSFTKTQLIGAHEL